MKSGWLQALIVGVLIVAGGSPSRAAEQRAVLITGASSGIGNLTAKTLAENGFYVYAGARKQADLEALDALENVTAVRLDVTEMDDISAAVELVEKQGRGLYAVVNNAGVSVVGPLVENTQDDMDFIMDVNVYGPWRVTKAFMPLLMESKGRVITIGSGLGLISFPTVGAYNMSKHAVEAFSDTLGMEMADYGVSSTVIEPGGYKSDIDKNTQERMKAEGYSAEDSMVADRMKAFLERDGTRPNSPEPVPVANAVMKALNADSMRPRYLVAPTREQTMMMVTGVMDKLVQISTENGFDLSRAELIEVLDASLEKHGLGKKQP